MRRIRILASVGLLFGLLAGCASAPGLPETTYYRLPEAAPLERLPEPVVALPVVVETFFADGLYSDQALIYSLDPDASRLRTYHYQIWIDPPVRLLQRRLISAVRSAGVARVVTDRLPAHMDTLRITGRIVRLERVRTASGWEAVVTLALRADPSGGGRPWLIGEYHRQVAAQGESVADSVRAFGEALDGLNADFIADLVERALDGHKTGDAVRMR